MEFYLNELPPYAHFYIAPYSKFSSIIGITFTRRNFWFEINHNNGTVYCKAHFEPLSG